MRVVLTLWMTVVVLARVVASEAQTTGDETQVVLTPKPSPQPRINGARIFGVRPGHPLLFTIAATGRRPLQFAAEGLPEGLTLDSRTGQIAGRTAKRGEHVVTLRAVNELGAAERKLRIVVGDRLALTPHMGWNSWYIWTDRVSDKIMRDAADAMVTSGMIDHGYMYVNIDGCWQVKPDAKDPSVGGPPRDAQGRINPNRRFPDMKAMTDYIHRRGFKAGIYSSPGPTDCAGHVGSYRHETEDARRFAEWGFDFLKYDWCSYGTVAGGKDLAHLRKPYERMWSELQKVDRDIVLNLCQYGMGDVWKWGASCGNSWRTAGDLGWPSDREIYKNILRDGFGLYADRQLHKSAGPGGWNDPDYLLLGYVLGPHGQERTPLSPNEQYTYVSLWSLVAAPLIFSGDMNRLDDFTLGLLSNDEVIDVDQDPLGRPGYRVAKQGSGEVWVRELEDGSKAVGLFNHADAEATVAANWMDLGVRGKQTARDLWRQKDLGQFEGRFSATVPRHAVVLVRLTPAP